MYDTPMASFTHANLLEVEDAAAKHGVSDRGAARFAREALQATQTGVALHQLKPGKRQAFGHRHQSAEEVYVVVAGGGRARLNEETVQLAPLDALRVSPEVARRFEAGDEGLDMLVFGQHFDRDGELLPDFWAE